ncbi:MAG TPA: hypothetical protein VHB73_01170 [Alphaproteobacteria bacterium]|nr:hypothetical protein [Alphaproteobacteria bacterium]
MKPVSFPLADGVLGAPDNWDEKSFGPCMGLPVYRPGNGCCISCWEVSAEELAALQAGGKIFIGVHGGNETQPPISLWVEPAAPGAAPENSSERGFMPEADPAADKTFHHPV